MKNRKLLGTLAFVGVIIFGTVFATVSLLGLLNIDYVATLAAILNFAKAVAYLLVLLVVVIVGWEGASGQKTWLKVLFLVFAILAVVGAVLSLI